jgi:hypothetical protein
MRHGVRGLCVCRGGAYVCVCVCVCVCVLVDTPSLVETVRTRTPAVPPRARSARSARAVELSWRESRAQVRARQAGTLHASLCACVVRCMCVTVFAFGFPRICWVQCWWVCFVRFGAGPRPGAGRRQPAAERAASTHPPRRAVRGHASRSCHALLICVCYDLEHTDHSLLTVYRTSPFTYVLSLFHCELVCRVRCPL